MMMISPVHRLKFPNRRRGQETGPPDLVRSGPGGDGGPFGEPGKCSYHVVCGAAGEIAQCLPSGQ